MQEKSIGPPNIYLCGKVGKARLPNMAEAWTFSSSQYFQEAVSNVEKYLQDLDFFKLSTKINAPLSNNYRPELYNSPKLEVVNAAHYQSLIGILHWMVELGRIDILCEVSMM